MLLSTRITRGIGGVALGSVCAAASFFTTVEVAGADNSAAPVHQPGDGSTAYALDNFPTNEGGLTYGSLAAVADPADAPDLIAVIGQSGKSGFILKSDQELPGEEAKPVVPVYSIDGETKIDVFVRQYDGLGSITFEKGLTEEEKMLAIETYVEDHK